MSGYPAVRRLGKWLVSGFIPFAIGVALAFHFGFERGQERGRLEMKCAILAVVERLGDPAPAPGTITIGCDKLPSAKREAAA